MTNDKHEQLTRDQGPVDVLAFGAHPDDVEWGVGGTLLKLKETGTSFGIVDLRRDCRGF